MTRLVRTLTKADYPEPIVTSHCTEPGCEKEAMENPSPAFHVGWWRSHVQATGHTVVIEEHGDE